MPREKKKDWVVSGTAPVTIDGEPRYPGDEFTAEPGAVKFLVDIGAIVPAKKKD